MIRTVIIAGFLCTILFTSLGLASDVNSESYYRYFIDERIAKSEMIVNKHFGANEDTREKAKEHAMFFRNNKEQLVQYLIQNEVETKPYRVTQFMFRFYNESKRALAASGSAGGTAR